MNWTDKAILVQALNQGEYERAVTMMREHETDMDKQAVMMFVNGFSINETHLLHSIDEYNKFMAGETLTNTTDHYKGGKGGSTSKGFCFIEDNPKAAWRYLKGIVNPEVCMVLEIDPSLLTSSFGKYADYSDGKGTHCCLKK